MQSTRALPEGVFPVLVTPFDSAGSIDFRGLARVTEAVVVSGAAGIVYPTGASEVETLGIDERSACVAAVAAAIGGRVPFVVGTSASDGDGMAAQAAEAVALGATAAMVMPPAAVKRDPARLRLLIEVVASVGPLPIVLSGSGLSTNLIRKVISECGLSIWVKEETPDSRISELLTDPPPTLRGVLGGAGGRHILAELARGVIGSIPSCESVPAHVAIHAAFRAGRQDRARDRFDEVLPLLNFLGIYKAGGVKEILRRRGVLESAFCRAADAPVLDRWAVAELVSIMERLPPLDGLAAAGNETEARGALGAPAWIASERASGL